MAFTATALEVFIASPSDVPKERDVVREVIAEHNAVYARNTQRVLLPVGWETHSAPDLSGRPQQMINDRLLEKADLLIGMFWTRVGTETGVAVSGTIEEITRHRDAGKPVMLYFSSRPVVPEAFDSHQFDKLLAFKNWARGEGLVETYDDLAQFRSLLSRQLAISLQTHFEAVVDESGGRRTRRVQLSDDAGEMLLAAADGDGTVQRFESMGGLSLGAGDRAFVDDQSDARTRARWEAALQELEEYGLVSDPGYQRQIFTVTHQGYNACDEIKAQKRAT